jgi:chemotaxis protein MotB
MALKYKKDNSEPNENALYQKPQEIPGRTASHDDESNWLVSYADMMTLLCGFFIMLFSMAKMDAPKYDGFKEAMSKQFGGEYVSPTKEFAKFATQILKESGLETGAVVKSDVLGVSIVFESTVFFDTLSADVTNQGKIALSKLIDGIAKQQESNSKSYKIVVEGHTDGRPIIGGSFPSNWELSGARAARVVRMFLARGFSPDHLTAIGYADTRPQTEARSPNGTWNEAALAKNRRVVLRILEPQVDAIPFPEDSKSPQYGPPEPPTLTPPPVAPASAPVAPGPTASAITTQAKSAH